jgi:cytidine deaminase
MLSTYIKNAVAKKTKVCAELHSHSGEVYYGVNVESSCHSLSVCAERAALINAVIHEGPSLVIDEVKVIAERAGERIPITPCGACLQFLSEFASRDLTINDIPIRTLFPFPYK